MAGTNDEGSGASSSREGEEDDAPPFADFSSFPKMIRQDREAARAEREAADAGARMELETVAAEQRRLMVEFFELKLQLTQIRGSKWGDARGEP